MSQYSVDVLMLSLFYRAHAALPWSLDERVALQWPHALTAWRRVELDAQRVRRECV